MILAKTQRRKVIRPILAPFASLREKKLNPITLGKETSR